MLKVEMVSNVMIACNTLSDWKYERVGDAINFEKGSLDNESSTVIEYMLGRIFNLGEELEDITQDLLNEEIYKDES